MVLSLCSADELLIAFYLKANATGEGEVYRGRTDGRRLGVPKPYHFTNHRTSEKWLDRSLKVLRVMLTRDQ